MSSRVPDTHLPDPACRTGAYEGQKGCGEVVRVWRRAQEREQSQDGKERASQVEGRHVVEVVGHGALKLFEQASVQRRVAAKELAE